MRFINRHENKTGDFFQLTKEASMDKSLWPDWMQQAYSDGLITSTGTHNGCGSFSVKYMSSVFNKDTKIPAYIGLNVNDYLLRFDNGVIMPLKKDKFEVYYVPADDSTTEITLEDISEKMDELLLNKGRMAAPFMLWDWLSRRLEH